MTTPIAQGPVDVTVGRHSQTLHELLACCRAWEADVRILGNVRAEDAANAIAYCLDHIPEAGNVVIDPAQQKLLKVLKAAVELVCAPAWAGVSNEDVELERVLIECGFVTPNAE